MGAKQAATRARNKPTKPASKPAARPASKLAARPARAPGGLRLTVLGAGQLGETPIRGLIEAGLTEPALVTVTTLRETRSSGLARRLGVRAVASNAEAVRGADVVLLTVKPQQVVPVLREVGPLLVTSQLLISAASSVSTRIIEKHLKTGVKVGLPRDVALRLAAQTVLGAGMMVRETGQHPALLKDAVTTPSGTTIDGILELEGGGLRVALLKAVVRATRRATERAHELFGDVPK